MNWLKRLVRKFTSLRKSKELTEVYILNSKYCGDGELQRHIEQRKQYCNRYGIDICFDVTDFKDDCYGVVRLCRGNEILSSATLWRKNDLIYWKYNE